MSHRQHQLRFHTTGNWTRHTHCTSAVPLPTTNKAHKHARKHIVQRWSLLSFGDAEHTLSRKQSSYSGLWKFCMKMGSECKWTNVLKWYKHLVGEQHISTSNDYHSQILRMWITPGIKEWCFTTTIYLGIIQEHAWEARGISIWKSIPQENQHGECQNSNMYTCIYASLCLCVCEYLQ